MARLTMDTLLNHPLAAQRDEHGTPIRYGPETPNGRSAVARAAWRERLRALGSAGAGLSVPRPIRPPGLGLPSRSRAERVQRRRESCNRRGV